MSDRQVPQIDCQRQHPALCAPDLEAALDFYTTKLGFTLEFTAGDPPDFAGVNLGDVQMFLRKGAASPQGCSVFFVVGNADELFQYHKAQGVEIVHPPGDRPHGLRDYLVRDLNGYQLGFGHYIYNVGSRVEIERVDLPVRLEKRLAALVMDLAAYKRMSLSSCLEETLLHTLDGVEPHTKADLRQIAKLKEQHGIDYDSHASYRWMEKPHEDVTVDRLKEFLDAFNRHDLDAIMEFFADDCVFYMPRGTAPRGDRYVGKDAVRAGLAQRFRGIPDVHYGDDRHWKCGSDFGVSEWTLTGTSTTGARLEVRGVDLLEFAGGRITRKDSFWKIVE